MAAGTPPAPVPPLPADFLGRIVQDEQTMRLTLPNGHPVVGKIEVLERKAGKVARIEGTIQHPEPGVFSFTAQPRDGAPDLLAGSLRLSTKTTQWKIQPATANGQVFQLVELPADDAFRPPVMQMPTAPNGQATPAMTREHAEDALRNDLHIEQIAPGKLRIGLLELDQKSRSIRFPAAVNMRAGVVEYALVTTTGKCHEAVFSTKAAPRDIHLAMLLLGIKPADCRVTADHALTLSPAATVRVTAEWDANGTRQSHSLAELLAFTADAHRPDSTNGLPERLWHYNGSCFNSAGFGATLEGSIISLIADDTALINNPGDDRANDTIHAPNTKLLPPVGAPVTIIIAKPPPASLTDSEPSAP